MFWNELYMHVWRKTLKRQIWFSSKHLQSYKNSDPLVLSQFWRFNCRLAYLTTNEPRHDKTNKMTVRPAKTQISLGIRPVWSESSLSAWRKLGSLATH